MKKLISALMIISIFSCYSQEDIDNSSFMTKNKPISLFSNIKSDDSKYDFNLVSTDLVLSENYQSDFRNFMITDSRMLNYPASDLSKNNNVVFGSYMNSNVNLGNTTLKTFYVFDHTGRLIDTTASFSFGKKKRN